MIVNFSSKLDQNNNQKLDQQIKTIIKKQINESKVSCNLGATVTESEGHFFASKLDQNINKKLDQQIKD